MWDIVDNEEADQDTVDENTLEQLFDVKYKLLAETAVSTKCYLNKIHGNKSLHVAVGLSDNTIQVYSLSNSRLANVCKLSGHEHSLADVVWCPSDEHALYSAGADGVVRRWDTRRGGHSVHEYKDGDDETVRPYESMDVSHAGRVLCAGTQLVDDDAFLVFWDPRSSKPLGGYWNSHTDDITQVKFHKSKGSILASGSLDGLVNVYDIAEGSEDDALTYSLNVGDAVEALAWLGRDRLAAVTQPGDWSLWDAAAGDRLRGLARADVAHAIRRSNAADCYLVDTLLAGDEPMLLAGSLSDGCLRALSVREKSARPLARFPLNRQLVRACWQHHQSGTLFTAGERGLLSAWGPESRGPGAGAGAPGAVAVKGARGLRRHRPY